MSLFRCLAGLSMVTALASGYDVIPLVAALTVAGEDVVQGEFTHGLATVLASELVAKEDVAAGEAALGAGTADEVDETDYGWDFEDGGDGVKVAAPVFDDFCLATIDKYERPPNVADVKRLEILIED